MSSRPDHEIAAEFVSAMEAGGVKPAETITQALLTGELVRFTVDGDRASRQNGWARLFLDGRPAGAYGCYKRQISEKWKLDAPQKVFSRAERQAYAKLMAAKRQAEADAKLAVTQATAERAVTLLRSARSASADHAYLRRKEISPTGLFQIHASVVVPMSDAMGQVWNLQFISPDGSKTFLTKGRTSGLCWSVGSHPARVLVGEGVATMAAIHAATGATCYAGFSAGNLMEAAKLARLVYRDADITICGDDDAHLVDHPQVGYNVGIKAATAAACEVGATLALPPRPYWLAAGNGWDFADIKDPRTIRVAIDSAVRPATSAMSIGAFGSIGGRVGGCAW